MHYLGLLPQILFMLHGTRGTSEVRRCLRKAQAMYTADQKHDASASRLAFEPKPYVPLCMSVLCNSCARSINVVHSSLKEIHWHCVLVRFHSSYHVPNCNLTSVGLILASELLIGRYALPPPTRPSSWLACPETGYMSRGIFSSAYSER
jgi:hypothetical protein